MGRRRYKERYCPGCGVVGRRRAQELCRNCERLLALGRKREGEIAKLAVGGEKIPVAIDTGFGYGFGRGCAIGFLKFGHTDVVDALVWLGGLEDAGGSGMAYKDARPVHFSYSVPYKTRPWRFVWATGEQADAIERVLSYVREMGSGWYKAGFAAGSDVLRSIAESGVEELNRITMMREAG